MNLANTTAGVSVKWNKVDGAQGYYVYRKGESEEWDKIATVDETTAAYTDKSVKSQSGKVFCYTVRAYCDDGEGIMMSDFAADAKIKWLSTPTVSLANTTSGLSV